MRAVIDFYRAAMISAENISKGFGAQELFEGASFKINRRERVGLVGRNGHGKTTLFRLISGDARPDAGSIVAPRGYRIGYVRQHLEFVGNSVVLEAMRGLPQEERHQRWKAEKVLAGLGFSTTDLDRHPAEFSGGFQVRLNLARILISEPDLLLLDEPTNYLDITSIRWIERFLLSWPRELILITHDRSFMDKVVTHTMGIHRGKIRKFSGTTEKYYARLAQDEEVYEKTRVNDERRRKEIELFISRFRAKARLANLVQSRMKTLEKMRRRNKLETLKTLDFSFRYKPFQGKHMTHIKDVAFWYDPGTPLLKGLNLSIKKGDRVCVVGRNGKGKTTLLKLMAGVVAPRQGEIFSAPHVAQGFFEQTNVSCFVETRTVEEEILATDADVDNQTARNICGAMMFEGDNALKKISVISGGEKSRVLLGKILAQPVNMLLLDEPTNHLDMESCDALLAALDSFEGAVVMVTHNELFLHALAQRLVVFQGDSPYVFEGSYQRFLEGGGWGDEPMPRTPLRVRSEKTAGDKKLNRKGLRRMRSEFFAQRSKTIGPLNEKIGRVESEIESRERCLSDCAAALQEACLENNGAKVAELSRSIHAAQTSVDQLYVELEKLSDELEKQTRIFDAQLKQLEELEAAAQ